MSTKQRPYIIHSFSVDAGDLASQHTRAVEVVIRLHDGRSRWCYFMTPQALTNCGDWIDGTQIRVHYGMPHVVVVAAPLDEALIGRALRHIEREGRLEECTMQLEPEPGSTE